MGTAVGWFAPLPRFTPVAVFTSLKDDVRGSELMKAAVCQGKRFVIVPLALLAEVIVLRIACGIERLR